MAAVVLAGGLPVIAAAPASAAPLPPSAPAPAPAPQSGAASRSAPDVATATAQAALLGEPVEVVGERTQTSSTWVRPDGLRSTSQFAGPVWVRRGGDPAQESGWAPVDLRLQRGSDGNWRPAAGVAELVVSGGSSTPISEIVRLAVPGGHAAVDWDGPLPAPQVSGARAVFPEVRAGIDLVVEATRTGFEQFFVLKQRPDARGLVPLLALTLRSDGVNAVDRPAGGTDLLDGAGKVVASVPSPVMWDAGADGQRHYPVAGPGGLREGLGAGARPQPPAGRRPALNRRCRPGAAVHRPPLGSPCPTGSGQAADVPTAEEHDERHDAAADPARGLDGR
jgi:hypothetical protein